MPQQPPRWLPVAPWAFILVWSAGYAVASVCLEYTEPLTLLVLRFGGTLVVLTPLLLYIRPAFPDGRDLVSILQIACCVQLAHFGCVYIGLELGASAGVIALFAASQPVLVNIVGTLVARRLPPARMWIGLAFGLAGVGWVLFTKGVASKGALLGAALGFVAVVGISIGSTIEHYRKPRCHRLMNFWLQYAFAAFASLPFAIYYTPFSVSTELDFLVAWGYLVFGNALLGIYLLLTMMRYGRVGQVSSVMFLVPIAAAAIAWVVLGEVLPVVSWPGVVLAAVGVLLVLYSRPESASV